MTGFGPSMSVEFAVIPTSVPLTAVLATVFVLPFVSTGTVGASLTSVTVTLTVLPDCVGRVPLVAPLSLMV